MKSKLEQYVENIVRHTECSKEEKEDLFEELLVHLELSRDEFLKEGLSQDEAEKKAMAVFGAEGEIGSQIQQAIFPYRKELMLTLAVSSLLFTISNYTVSLFVEGDAFIGWLLFSMVISGMLLFLPLNQHIHLNKKTWLNALLVLHIFGQLYGWLIASQLPNETNIGLTIWVWLNLALTIGLVYRTTIYDYSPEKNYMKILHGLNITSGFIIIGASLFFIGGGLIMIGSFHPMMLVFATPIVLWIVLYMVQLEVVKKSKKAAFAISSLPYVLCLIIFLWIYSPVFN
jgi:hypothetical protein